MFIRIDCEEGWVVRPVCSTVPPRVWQKYLWLGSVDPCPFGARQMRSMLPRQPLPQQNLDGHKAHALKDFHPMFYIIMISHIIIYYIHIISC